MAKLNELVWAAGLIPANSSGILSSSSLVHTGRCLLTGIKVNTDGVNDASVSVYDNTEASGKVVDSFKVAAAELYGGVMYGKSPVLMDNGIYVGMSGGSVEVIIFYFDADSTLHSKTIGTL